MTNVNQQDRKAQSRHSSERGVDLLRSIFNGCHWDVQPAPGGTGEPGYLFSYSPSGKTNLTFWLRDGDEQGIKNLKKFLFSDDDHFLMLTQSLWRTFMTDMDANTCIEDSEMHISRLPGGALHDWVFSLQWHGSPCVDLLMHLDAEEFGHSFVKGFYLHEAFLNAPRDFCVLSQEHPSESGLTWQACQASTMHGQQGQRIFLRPDLIELQNARANTDASGSCSTAFSLLDAHASMTLELAQQINRALDRTFILPRDNPSESVLGMYSARYDQDVDNLDQLSRALVSAKQVFGQEFTIPMADHSIDILMDEQVKAHPLTHDWAKLASCLWSQGILSEKAAQRIDLRIRRELNRTDSYIEGLEGNQSERRCNLLHSWLRGVALQGNRLDDIQTPDSVVADMPQCWIRDWCNVNERNNWRAYNNIYEKDWEKLRSLAVHPKGVHILDSLVFSNASLPDLICIREQAKRNRHLWEESRLGAKNDALENLLDKKIHCLSSFIFGEKQDATDVLRKNVLKKTILKMRR